MCQHDWCFILHGMSFVPVMLFLRIPQLEIQTWCYAKECSLQCYCKQMYIYTHKLKVDHLCLLIWKWFHRHIRVMMSIKKLRVYA
jgi:hypothetical protein